MKTFLPFALLLVCVFGIGRIESGEEPTADPSAVAKAKARALLLLAAREREDLAVKAAREKAILILHQLGDDRDCLSNLDDAKAKAKAEGKQLFIWVPGCVKALREAFPEAVHCHVPTYKGSASKRLIIPMPDGEYFLPGERLTLGEVSTIRATIKR